MQPTIHPHLKTEGCVVVYVEMGVQNKGKLFNDFSFKRIPTLGCCVVKRETKCTYNENNNNKQTS